MFPQLIFVLCAGKGHPVPEIHAPCRPHCRRTGMLDVPRALAFTCRSMPWSACSPSLFLLPLTSRLSPLTPHSSRLLALSLGCRVSLVPLAPLSLSPLSLASHISPLGSPLAVSGIAGQARAGHGRGTGKEPAPQGQNTPPSLYTTIINFLTVLIFSVYNTNIVPFVLPLLHSTVVYILSLTCNGTQTGLFWRWCPGMAHDGHVQNSTVCCNSTGLRKVFFSFGGRDSAVSGWLQDKKGKAHSGVRPHIDHSGPQVYVSYPET